MLTWVREAKTRGIFLVSAPLLHRSQRARLVLPYWEQIIYVQITLKDCQASRSFQDSVYCQRSWGWLYGISACIVKSTLQFLYKSHLKSISSWLGHILCKGTSWGWLDSNIDTFSVSFPTFLPQFFPCHQGVLPLPLLSAGSAVAKGGAGWLHCFNAHRRKP